MKIKLWVSRKDAIKWMAWEFGLADVQRLLAKAEKDHRGWIECAGLSLFSIERDRLQRARRVRPARRWVESLGHRVSEACVYQNARLGRGLKNATYSVQVAV
ncbi:MAG: hypothetical protein KDI01_02880 [Halioglobus sp.]|nr:hypothetical protein [Halioglobus sp.]